MGPINRLLKLKTRPKATTNPPINWVPVEITVRSALSNNPPCIGAKVSIGWYNFASAVPLLTTNAEGKVVASVPENVDIQAIAIMEGFYDSQRVMIGKQRSFTFLLTPKVVVPAGRVVTSGRNFVDAKPGLGLPSLRLGVTWFWGPNAYKESYSNFAENASWLAKAANVAPRMFGQVINGGRYVNRQVTQSGLVGAMNELATVHGLRSLPVILGDCSDLNPTQKMQEVNYFCDLLVANSSVLNYIVMAEIGNEGGHTGLQDIGLLAQLTKIVRDRFPDLLVACTSAEDYPWPDDSGGQIPEVYGRGNSNAFSMHPSRGGDINAKIRQTYGYNFLNVPRIGGATEPWGPASSIAQTTTYEHVAATALVNWISGWGLFVFHCGTGIYGQRYDSDYGPRYANFFDDPSVVDILPKLEKLRSNLPQDLAGFGNITHADPKNNGNFPFVTLADQMWDREFKDTGCRAYAAISPDGRFVVAVVGQTRDFAIEPRNSANYRVRDMEWNLIETNPTMLRVPKNNMQLIEGRFV